MQTEVTPGMDPLAYLPEHEILAQKTRCQRLPLAQIRRGGHNMPLVDENGISQHSVLLSLIARMTTIDAHSRLRSVSRGDRCAASPRSTTTMADLLVSAQAASQVQSRRW